MEVYLEAGRRRVFAGALAWPGWCRAGRDEVTALQALVDYAPRYKQAIRAAPVPATVADLQLVERLDGDATTDFGAPGAIPAYDEQPPGDRQLAFLRELMEACWKAFDRAADSAVGRQLSPAGPRGGGRELDKIREHVLGAERSYLVALGGRAPAGTDAAQARQEFLTALGARARGELPERGPRGGRRWPARYAVRRAAWHLLDHAWEIEDRLSDDVPR
jgi:hypothetical protein